MEEKSRLVLAWCKQMMAMWQTNLDSKGEIFRATAEGRAEYAKYTCGRRDLRPLKKHLVKQTLAKDILDSLYLVVQYCLLKEYIRAHDKYVELAIGNSPWPMGVTMVGIHERSGRARIHTS